MRALFTLILPAFLVFAPGSMAVPAVKEFSPVNSVYICVSSTAYVYHGSSGCSGLNRCTHEIRKVSVSDAVNKYGRRACRISGCSWCYQAVNSFVFGAFSFHIHSMELLEFALLEMKNTFYFTNASTFADLLQKNTFSWELNYSSWSFFVYTFLPPTDKFFPLQTCM